MLIRVAIPETFEFTSIQIDSYQSEGWTGSIDGAHAQYPWGVIPDAPWISLFVEGGRVRIDHMAPVWCNDFVAAYTLDGEGTLYLLRLSQTIHRFYKLADLVQYVIMNTVCTTQYNKNPIPFSALEPDMRTQNFTINFTYLLEGTTLIVEEEEFVAGWIGNHSTRTVSGKRIVKSDRSFSDNPTWIVESLGPSHKYSATNKILEVLLDGTVWAEELEGLSCYSRELKLGISFEEPTKYDVVDSPKFIIKHHFTNRETGDIDPYMLGMFLNYPILICPSGDYIVLPTRDQIAAVVHCNERLVDEIHSKVYDMFCELD